MPTKSCHVIELFPHCFNPLAGRNIVDVEYADDTALIGLWVPQIEALLHKLEDRALEDNMLLNPGKSQHGVFRGKRFSLPTHLTNGPSYTKAVCSKDGSPIPHPKEIKTLHLARHCWPSFVGVRSQEDAGEDDRLRRPRK